VTFVDLHETPRVQANPGKEPLLYWLTLGWIWG